LKATGWAFSISLSEVGFSTVSYDGKSFQGAVPSFSQRTKDD